MKFRIAVGAGVLVSLAIAATDKNPVLSVPLNIKIGLWQMTYTTERNGTPRAPAIAPELLAKMNPEQRARTEARLKARAIQGVQVETRKYCMTEERLKKAIFENPETGAVCPRTFFVSTPKDQQFHDECTEGGAKRIVDGRFEALDVDTMKGSLKAKTEGGNAYAVNVDIAGRWIAADCGNESQ
jgi:hypothetical protein